MFNYSRNYFFSVTNKRPRNAADELSLTATFGNQLTKLHAAMAPIYVFF